jgi:hypothetical protein
VLVLVGDLGHGIKYPFLESLVGFWDNKGLVWKQVDVVAGVAVFELCAAVCCASHVIELGGIHFAFNACGSF